MDISKLAEKLAQLNAQGNRGGGNGMRFHSIADGRNLFRILPAHANSEMFFEEVWVHYGVGKTDQNKKGHMVVCLTTHGDSKPCPICEVVKELRNLSKVKDDTYSKQASSLNRKKRVYFNAINRADDLTQYAKNEEGKWVNADGEEQSPVGVLATGVTVFKDLLSIIEDPEYGDVTDAEEGLDVIITKTGTSFNTSYDTKTVRKNSPIGFAEWQECLYDLTTLKKGKPYEELEAILNGEDYTPEDTKETAKGGDNTAPAPTDAAPAPAVDAPNVGDDLQEEIKAALARRNK